MPRSKGVSAATAAAPAERFDQMPSPADERRPRLDFGAVVRSRLFWAGRSPAAAAGDEWLPELRGFEAERERLASALRQTAEHGESNSLLVVGPRGCGKTLLVETALRDARLSPATPPNPHAAAQVVRLSGLLHTDEQLALAELARQLRLENVVAASGGGERVLGSRADQQQFLLDALRSGDRQASRPIVVVLDEFDLFAQHRNQSLLYNLLDAAQSRQTPLCVVGVTCRLDVFELLEKRVKSRHSHRAIYMLDARPYDDYERLFVDCLSVPPSADAARATPAAAAEWNRSVARLVEGGVGSGESLVRRELRHCHRVASRDVRALQRIVFRTLCNAAARAAAAGCGSSGDGADCGAVAVAGDVLEAVKAEAADSAAATLRGVSVLELALMIAMRQLAELYDGEPVNFSTVYDRYRAFYARASAGGKACDKAVALKAFEHLLELELVQPATATAADGCGGTPKEYRLVHLLVDGAQLAETLQTYTGCPTEIRQWASSGPMATA